MPENKTFRERVARVLLGPEMRKLEKVTEVMLDAYQSRPVSFGNNPEELFEKLRETVDAQTVDLLLRRLQYTEGTYNSTTEEMRLSIVKESRSLRVFDPITQFSIEIWTDYGFSSKPQISPKDESARETWLDFWNARENQYLLSEQEIQDLSNTSLIDGEIIFAFFISRADGAVIVRTIPTEEIKEIISSPNDKKIPVFYRRDFSQVGEDNYATNATVYYRDWRASPDLVATVRAKLPVDSKVADDINGGDVGTDVVILHAAFRKINGRGWPLLTAGMDWSRAYRGFLQDRAAVAKMAATFTEKIKVKNSGQRAVDMVKARIESTLASSDNSERNPVPAAGSTWIENDQLSREWMNRPTGASDAEKDGIPLLTQAGLAAKLYPHYLGRGDYYRLATASALEGPVLKSFNRYQSFWSSIWQDMTHIVLGAANTYGNKNFQTTDADVSLDNILSADLESSAKTAQALNDFSDRGLIDPTVGGPAATEILRVMMQSLGIDSTDDIVNPQNKEASKNGNVLPFAESVDTYRKALKYVFRGLWSGAMTTGDFVDSMTSAVNTYVKEGFLAGIKAGGIDPNDIDDDSQADLLDYLSKEEKYIDGVAAFIVSNNKASGKKFAVLETRLEMWANGWEKAYGAGLQSVVTNPPVTWHYGDTVKHCDDCKYAEGRTYRAKTWKKWGWEVRSRKLSCHGYECDCRLTADGNKPMKGHPRRLG